MGGEGVVSNWILMSCQPHRVTPGQSKDHKQMHISKLRRGAVVEVHDLDIRPKKCQTQM